MRPIDKAKFKIALMGAGLSQKELAIEAGKSQGYIAKMIGLGKASEEVLKVLNDHGVGYEEVQPFTEIDYSLYKPAMPTMEDLFRKMLKEIVKEVVQEMAKEGVI